MGAFFAPRSRRTAADPAEPSDRSRWTRESTCHAVGALCSLMAGPPSAGPMTTPCAVASRTTRFPVNVSPTRKVRAFCPSTSISAVPLVAPRMVPTTLKRCASMPGSGGGGALATVALTGDAGDGAATGARSVSGAGAAPSHHHAAPPVNPASTAPETQDVAPVFIDGLWVDSTSLLGQSPIMANAGAVPISSQTYVVKPIPGQPRSDRPEYGQHEAGSGQLARQKRRAVEGQRSRVDEVAGLTDQQEPRPAHARCQHGTHDAGWGRQQHISRKECGSGQCEEQRMVIVCGQPTLARPLTNDDEGQQRPAQRNPNNERVLMSSAWHDSITLRGEFRSATARTRTRFTQQRELPTWSCSRARPASRYK